MIDIVGWTHRGNVRDHNEDALALPGVVMCAAPLRPVWWRLNEAIPGLLLAVIDGMGGHRGGAHASHSAASAIALRSLAVPGLLGDALGELIRDINRELYAEMERRPDLTAMGATVVAGVVSERGMVIANAGDARAYVHSGGYTTMVTIDDRVLGRNTISQCLGGTDRPVAVTPHMVEVPLSPGDRVLMCSDGLSDTVAFGDIQGCLGADDPYEVVLSLMNAALSAGAADNVTILLYSKRC